MSVDLANLADGTKTRTTTFVKKSSNVATGLAPDGSTLRSDPLGPTSETDLTLENFPTTGTLKFYVQATNLAGDSPKSTVAETSLGNFCGPLRARRITTKHITSNTNNHVTRNLHQ
jgi:hypothetical protein